MRTPEVSICIPSYNHGAFIGKAIQSVLDQTFRNLELVIVDDCSTDNSVKVIKSFRDPRIKFFRNKKNLGMVPNTNKILRLAKGKFIGILSSDDYYDPKMIETALEIFDKYPGVGLTFSPWVLVDEKGKVITKTELPRDKRLFKAKEGFKRLALANLVPPSGVIFKKRCYDAAGPFDEEFPYCHDWNMWLRLSLRYDFACLPDYLFYYRIHSGNTTIALYNSFETALQEYGMLKKLQKEVDPELSAFLEEGAKRASRRALLNSIGGLLQGGRSKALEFFSVALGLRRKNLVWPPAPLCLFAILAGWNGVKLSAGLCKKLLGVFKQFAPFHNPETIFYRYGL